MSLNDNSDVWRAPLNLRYEKHLTQTILNANKTCSNSRVAMAMAIVHARMDGRAKTWITVSHAAGRSAVDKAARRFLDVLFS